jgi:hypothetical protein
MAEATETITAYEVLSPWAEADPRPLHGIVPRLADLSGRRIGLFAGNKPAAPRIMDILEQKLKVRFPTCEISRYNADESFLIIQMAGKNRQRFEEWLSGVDAVAAAVGD